MNHHRGVRLLAALIAALLVLSLTGCAMQHEKNRRLLNRYEVLKYLDKAIQPETKAGKIAMGVPGVVIGTGGVVANMGIFAVDAAVVHPIVSIREAAKDTYELFWKPRDQDPFNRALLFVPVCALTPVVFSVDWAVRVVFGAD